MNTVMLCWGPVHDVNQPVNGEYLETFDPDAHDGRGEATFTPDITKAKRFPSTLEALQEWQRPSTIRPHREDGRMNRPLTAFSASFEQV